MIDRNVIKAALLATVALGTLSSAGQACAQVAPAPTSASDESPVSDDLGDIIVTANKRNESLIKVPQSLTAISGDALAYRNQTRIEDFAAQVPGFNLQSFGNKGLKLILRGINAGAAAATTAVVIDETPFSYQSGLALGDRNTANIDTFDMERIEVLKGPQGTLYGASAEGGLLKYVTNKPDPKKLEAAVEASGETVAHGGTGGAFKAMINLPFWDGKGAIRASGFYAEVPGYADNVLIGRNDTNNGHRYGGRISILLAPTEDFSVRLTASRQDQRFFDDGSIDVVGSDSDPYNPPANQFDAASGGRLVHNSYYGNPSNNTYELANLTANWDIGFADLVSSTSYGKLSSQFRLDITTGSYSPGVTYAEGFGNGYASPLAIRTRQTNAGRRWNQELRLTSKPDSSIGGMKLDWLLGGFFAHESNTFDQFFQFVNIPTNQELTTPAPGGGSTLPSTYREFSAFGNATLHISDKLFVQGGIRYAHINQSSTVTSYPGFFTGATSIVVNPTLTSSENKATWSAQVGYNVTSNSLIYGRVATGYRSGGPQFAIPGAPADVPLTYKPDSLTNYEVGFRTSLLHKMLTIDVAAFYIDWKDVQVTTSYRSTISGIEYQITGNAGAASSKGVEWAFGLSPVKGLKLSTTGAYTEAHLTKDAPDLPGFKGDDLAFVPRWSTSVSLDYEARLSDGVKGFAGVSWDYTGKRFADFSLYSVSHFELPSYSSASGQAGVDFGKYSASLYVRNLTDERGITTYGQNGGYNFTGNATIIQPRTIGIKLTARY
uniref:TonB-dependent receptor n=1 Tax=uncultured Sphingomonas sp. TaxID=158754 RepID=UPI0035CA54A7